MGITGLLPLLKPATEQDVPLSRFRGKVIAVDGNVWIHRGTHACAVELAQGVPTMAYVHYCRKLCEMCVSQGLRLMVVFDGRSLPAKGPAHQRRREKRKEANQRCEAYAELTREQLFSMEQEEDPELKRKLGDQLGQLQHDQERSARTAAHVTDDMVRQVMFALSRLPGVSVMRAPYEADAQLAFLARQNLVHAVLTEDSDLVAYCLPRVLFKLDRQNATVQLIEKQNLMKVKTPSFNLTTFTDEMFLQMCILSGVDYLDSPKGLGLKTANTLMIRMRDGQRVIKHLRNHMSKKVDVPIGYAQEFCCALTTFRHQRVWSPNDEKVVPLTPLPPPTVSSDPPPSAAREAVAPPTSAAQLPPPAAGPPPIAVVGSEEASTEVEGSLAEDAAAPPAASSGTSPAAAVDATHGSAPVADAIDSDEEEEQLAIRAAQQKAREAALSAARPANPSVGASPDTPTPAASLARRSGRNRKPVSYVEGSVAAEDRERDAEVSEDGPPSEDESQDGDGDAQEHKPTRPSTKTPWEQMNIPRRAMPEPAAVPPEPLPDANVSLNSPLDPATLEACIGPHVEDDAALEWVHPSDARPPSGSPWAAPVSSSDTTSAGVAFEESANHGAFQVHKTSAPREMPKRSKPARNATLLQADELMGWAPSVSGYVPRPEMDMSDQFGAESDGVTSATRDAPRKEGSADVPPADDIPWVDAPAAAVVPPPPKRVAFESNVGVQQAASPTRTASNPFAMPNPTPDLTTTSNPFSQKGGGSQPQLPTGLACAASRGVSSLFIPQRDARAPASSPPERIAGSHAVAADASSVPSGRADRNGARQQSPSSSTLPPPKQEVRWHQGRAPGTTAQLQTRHETKVGNGKAIAGKRKAGAAASGAQPQKAAGGSLHAFLSQK